MNSKHLAAVAFAVLGLAALLSSVPILQGLMMFPFYPDVWDGKTFAMLLTWLFPLAVLVTAGVFLIVKRFRLAAWVVFDSNEIDSERAWKELPDLAFAVLGLYLVISSLPSLGSLAGQVVNLKAAPSLQESLPTLRASLGFFLGTLAKFVIGGYLFINAREVGGWWRRGGKTERNGSEGPGTCPECDSPFDVDDYREAASVRLCSKCKAEIPDTAFE